MNSSPLDLDPLVVLSPPSEDFRTAADTFRARYADALQRYAVSLSSPAAEFLVAVPRKAPRLLELIHEAPQLPDVPLAVALSERALPFIARETFDGARIVLTDDTVIYGSTFAGALDTLRSAGARVYPRVLGVSRTANPAVTDEFPDPPLRLGEGQIHELIDLEIQAFGSLAVPYDIDHPIVTVELDHPELAVQQFLAGAPAAWESTRAWQSEHGIRVFTIPMPASVLTTHSQRERQLGPAKVRVFVDFARRAARVVGIYCVALRSAALEDPGLFAAAPTPLREAWQLILSATQEAGWPEESRRRALAGAAHYLASFEAVGRWLPNSPEPLRENRARLRHLDLRWAFGHELADRLLPVLEDVLAGESEFYPAQPLQSGPVVFDPVAEAQAILAAPSGPQLSEALTAYLAMSHPDDPGDRAHALFNAQRRVYDESTRTGEAPDASRLSHSLMPFAAVPAMLATHGTRLPPEEFDYWCDLAIDGGSIVPQYHPSASQPDLWVRCVRAGERRNEKLKYWVCSVLDRAAKHRDDGLPWYVAEKAMATLVACLEPELRAELRKPVVSGRDQFGARAQLPELKHEPFLLDWAQQVGIISRPRSGRNAVVEVRPEFEELFPSSKNTVSRTVRAVSRKIIDGFMTVESVLKGDDRELAILALSSCATEDEYLESLSTELDVWLSHSQLNVAGLAAQVVKAVDLPPSARADLDRRLKDSARALAQSDKKRAAFRRRVELRDALDELFQNDPALMLASDAWEEFLRVRIDDSAPRRTTSERYLLFACLLGRDAVSVVRALLSQLRLSEPAPDHTIERHVAGFNKRLAQARTRGLLIIEPKELTTEDFPLDEPRQALKRAGELLLDVEITVNHIWSAHRRPASAGVLERVTEDLAILMWDITGSAAGDPVDTGEVIHRVNGQIELVIDNSPGAEFHPTQNDGNVVIVPTVASAVAVFHGLRIVFENEGCFVRGAIETTVDADKLQRNKDTGQLNGRPYQLVARALAAFKEAASTRPAPEFLNRQGERSAIDAPTSVSYLNMTRRALDTLKYNEGIDEPEDTALYGIIRGFRPRVASTLPTDIYVFLPRS